MLGRTQPGEIVPIMQRHIARLPRPDDVHGRIGKVSREVFAHEQERCR
ncbi:MAG: hypothetical protein HC806_03075, partial [Anaerolineae bacterium]|nr:hypothetical protein [Anaerolineae bacterium]